MYKFDRERFFSLPCISGKYTDGKGGYCALGAADQAMGFVEHYKSALFLTIKETDLVVKINDGSFVSRKSNILPQPNKAKIFLYKLLKKKRVITEPVESVKLPELVCEKI